VGSWNKTAWHPNVDLVQALEAWSFAEMQHSVNRWEFNIKRRFCMPQLINSSRDNPATVGEALEIYFTGLIDGAVIPPRLIVEGHLAKNRRQHQHRRAVNLRARNGLPVADYTLLLAALFHRPKTWLCGLLPIL
jgi:hypothetical protein